MAITSVVPIIISAHPSAGISSLQDLVRLAQSKPDKIDVALAGVSSQLVLEMLRQQGVPRISDATADRLTTTKSLSKTRR